MIRKTECRSGHSPCGRGYRKKGRLHSGKRLYGDMGTGASGVTGLAGYIRLHENRRRRPSDDSRSVPSCRAAGTHRQGDGDGYRSRQAAQGHRRSVRRMREHHRGDRCRTRGGTHLPVDIFLSGLYQAVQTVVDLLAYRRGHPGGNGRPQGRNRI